MAPGALYEVPVKTILGEDKPFGEFARGKVTLVVNTASACGLTPQYAGLEDLYQRYSSRGFTVIGFPCNQCVFCGLAPARRLGAFAQNAPACARDAARRRPRRRGASSACLLCSSPHLPPRASPFDRFGGQAPGDSATEQNFACTKYKTTFQMMAKVDVNGDKEAPLWKALKDAKGSMLGRNIKWNFAKFLIARDGTVIERYLPTTSPASIAGDIEKLLGASA